MRLNASNVGRDLLDGFARQGAIEARVDIVEEHELSDAKLLCRRAQLGLARASYDLRPGRLARIVESSALAARRRHDIRANPFTGVFREHSSGSERLVVGVGEDTHQPK